MYEYFVGKITDITAKNIVVDVNGIGYLVYAANPYSFTLDETRKVYIHQSVSDTAVALYGFTSLSDKKLFEQLLNVSGIGSKSALAIMAGNDNTGLVNAIKTENVSFLVKFPGIGKKTAQQIILDLKDKINIENETPNNMAPQTETIDNPTIADALDALLALGFKDKDIKKIKPKLTELDPSYSTEDYISAGLKMLTK